MQVFDTGCGLSCDPKSLFKPYAQDMGGTARQTRNRFERGTGLGLAISAQLVKLMGGDIGLENRTDGVRGARFWFWVPCVRAVEVQGTTAVAAEEDTYIQAPSFAELFNRSPMSRTPTTVRSTTSCVIHHEGRRSRCPSAFSTSTRSRFLQPCDAGLARCVGAWLSCGRVRPGESPCAAGVCAGV